MIKHRVIAILLVLLMVFIVVILSTCSGWYIFTRYAPGFIQVKTYDLVRNIKGNDLFFNGCQKPYFNPLKYFINDFVVQLYYPYNINLTKGEESGEVVYTITGTVTNPYYTDIIDAGVGSLLINDHHGHSFGFERMLYDSNFYAPLRFDEIDNEIVYDNISVSDSLNVGDKVEVTFTTNEGGNISLKQLSENRSLKTISIKKIPDGQMIKFLLSNE